MTRDDILVFVVCETLRLHGVAEPALGNETVRICAQLRPDLGGQAHYIPRNPPALAAEDTRRRQIVADALTNMSTAEIQQRHGVSRATIYRLVKRHARKG